MRPTRGVRVLPPPALLPRIIVLAVLPLIVVLAAAPTRIAILGVPIALEIGAEAVPNVVARNEGIG